MSAYLTCTLDGNSVSQNALQPKIFYPTADKYIYPLNQGLEDPVGCNAYLPIEVDTEFYHKHTILGDLHPLQPSPTLTVQCRALACPTGTIFTHTDSEDIARHPVTTADFAIVDYLRSLGHVVNLARNFNGIDGLPSLQIDLYAFYAVAELFRVFKGVFRDDVKRLCLNAKSKGSGIVQNRRLRTYTRQKGLYLEWVAMPWIMTLNGHDYAVRIAWWDTSAVHGAGSYADFCTNTSTPIPYKDNFSSSEKADMRRMYLDRPDDFDNYALGDLYNHPALTRNIDLFKTIYESVGLQDYYRVPRLTTGATVRDLIESSIAKLFCNTYPGIEGRKIVNAYSKYGTTDEIKKKVTSTGAYNAKVDGGRCRNNRPTDTNAHGVICDLDISSCYGEGLRVQTYPLGVPVTIDYPIESERNAYLSLGDFLKKYRDELVPGLWQARISTPKGYRLKHPQDYLMSWIPPKDISKLATDTELIETDDWWTLDNVGLLKIFTHEIHLALINHDFIQWLENIATRRQRKELLENTRVDCALYYPASDRVNSVDELADAHRKHDGINTTIIHKLRGKTTKICIEQECHKWYGVSLGDLGITQLICERRKHPKKTPLNELYKLCINTTYGDMVSPYFCVGNVVVGNNITARARSLAWYMEKGLHGWQTITDGCAFNLNKVLHLNKSTPNGENVVGLYRALARNINLCFQCLGEYYKADMQSYSDGKVGLILSRMCTLSDDSCNDAKKPCEAYCNSCLTVLDPQHSLAWVNRIAMEHLQSLFPNVDVLHATTTDVDGNNRVGQFSFEAKGFYNVACFHGTANYLFKSYDDVEVVKMRSYTKKPVERLSLNSNNVADKDYYPAKEFLRGLIDSPTRLQRQSAFLRPRILKVGDFSRNYESRYRNSTVHPGMTVKDVSLLREFSLTQFTYQTLEQYLSWERESEGLRKRYGQSYEMYFLNSDETLNYQLMVETIDQMISVGKQGFWDGVDRRKQNIYRKQSIHPGHALLEAWRHGLAKYYRYQGCELAYDVDTELTTGDE